MAAISRYKAEQYVTKIFKEYLGALKEAKRNKEKLLPEANILFEDINQKFFDRSGISPLRDTNC